MDIITAREAYTQGLTRYFTGKPCSRGHTVERMISNGSCVQCLSENRKRSRGDIYEATKVWRLKNAGARTVEAEKYRNKYPEKVAARSKSWREKNLEANREREKLNARRLRAANPEMQRKRTERYRAKQIQKQVEIAGREKPDVCEVCGEFNIRIVFDHCHARGHFRGWLCDRCNKVLGLLKDDANLFRKLANYLEGTNNGITCNDP